MYIQRIYEAYSTMSRFLFEKNVIRKRSKPLWLSQDLLYVTETRHNLYKLLNRSIITRHIA